MVSDGPDGLICDLDGVLYRGTQVVPGAPEAVALLQDRGVKVLFCSNNSNPSRSDYVEKLSDLGLKVGEDDLLTSATVLEQMLKDEGLEGSTAFCIGGAGLREAVTGAGLEIVDHRDAQVVCVGFDLSFDYDAMRTATHALNSGASLYATNDDPSFPAADGSWPGAGAILASVETASGQRAVVVGKPHATMAEVAERKLADRSSIFVVGDRVSTDIAMGAARGWHTVLVLTGVTSSADVEAADPMPDEVLESLAEAPWAR